VTSLRRLLGDRKRRQRGSVLSAVLIIVAFISILIGGLMTELTSSFLASRVVATRVAREATVTSAVELGISQLQSRSVPASCAKDRGSSQFLSLNGSPAAVTHACSAIVPDLTAAIAPGAFSVDGIHDTTAGRNRYLIGDSSGRLYSYPFGQTAPSWSILLGGALTAPPLAKLDTSNFPDSLLVPVAEPGSACGGHCVELFDEGSGTPGLRCTMGASSAVNGQPAAEVTSGGSANFPDYVFFGDSGGHLYVYDASSNGGCSRTVAPASLGGAVVGTPLVFPGTVTRRGRVTTTTDEIFVLTTNGTSTVLHEYLYSEASDGEVSFNEDDTQNLAVGGSAIGYDTSSTLPTPGSTISLVVAGATGRLAIGRIRVNSNKSGATYSISAGPSANLPGAISHSPYWCHCPDQDLIGVGSTNGFLYLLSTGLIVSWTYDGLADGRPAINTSPAADANGDWYFGADDGSTYDVEIPVTGQQMFKAATFGPGGPIRSSPVVGGGADGCGSGPCLYFASSTSGGYFVRLGATRIIDLRACISTASGSRTCAANPRLWAQVEVGLPAVVGARGVYVQGWSYYSP
jgi:hypothetical protein